MASSVARLPRATEAGRPRPDAASRRRPARSVLLWKRRGAVQECAARSEGGCPEEGGVEAGRAAATFPAAVTVQVLRAAAVAAAAYAAYTPAASASEYVWLPRRHHRRMGEWKRTIPAVERVKENWEASGKSDFASSAKAKAADVKKAVETTHKTLSQKAKSSQQEFSMSMRAPPTRTKADQSVLNSIPVLGWVAAAVAVGAGWVLIKNPGILGSMTGGNRKGRWVRDRSMGGKMIFIPDEDDTTKSSGTRVKSASPLTEVSAADAAALTSVAAKWGSATGENRNATMDKAMPTWWDPPAYTWVPDDRKVELEKEARFVLKELQDVKLRGQDYPVWSLVELANKCAAGQVTVKAYTVNGRDAMLRAAMEACTEAAMSGSNTNIGGLRPAQLVSSLAAALEVPDEKAKSIANGAIAAKARSLLLSISAGFRAGDRSDILRPLMRLAGLLNAFPPTRGSAESDMLAASMKSAATLDERRGVLTLLFQMAPEAAPATAEMLGFDPDMVMPLLEQQQQQQQQSSSGS